MTRYQVHEQWGGGIAELVPDARQIDGTPLPDGWVMLRRDIGPPAILYRAALTQVPPPAPPEPEPGAYRIGRRLAVRFPRDTTKRRWALETVDVVGGFVDVTWDDLWASVDGEDDVTIRPLLPAPDVDWSRFPGADTGCSAHGDSRCLYCHRNPRSCATEEGACGMWLSTGKHWDTCPNRIVGPLTLSAATEPEPVELPWAGQSVYGTRVQVGRTSESEAVAVVIFHGTDAALDSATALDMAAALTAAARTPEAGNAG